jgi:hypothetical protein
MIWAFGIITYCLNVNVKQLLIDTLAHLAHTYTHTHTHTNQQHTPYPSSPFQNFSFAHNTVFCSTLCSFSNYQPLDSRPSATALLIALHRVTHLREVGVQARKRTQGFLSEKRKSGEVGSFSKHINFRLRFAETFHRRRAPLPPPYPRILASCAATLPVWPTGMRDHTEEFRASIINKNERHSRMDIKLPIWKVPGSNLGLQTGYPDSDNSWFHFRQIPG